MCDRRRRLYSLALTVALSVPDIAPSSEASDIKLDGAVRVTFGGATNDEIDCCFFELRANDPTEPALGSLLESTKTAGTCCAVCAARFAIPSRFRASLPGFAPPR